MQIRHIRKKTEAQVQALTKFYRSNKECAWTDSQLEGLVLTTQLSRQQIYKWLWDRRNNLKNRTKRRHLSHIDQEPFVMVDVGRFKVEAPAQRESAQLIQVHPEISSWAKKLLRTTGWQLIRQRHIKRGTVKSQPRVFQMIPQT